jgi:hypothetical protein
MTKPRIYNVLSFRKLEDGTRVVHSHMVAAFTSAEAEDEFFAASDPSMLEDREFFISSDAIRELDDHSNVYFFASGSSDTPKRDRMDDPTFRSWARAVLRDEWHDGDLSPATHRWIVPAVVEAAS